MADMSHRRYSLVHSDLLLLISNLDAALNMA